MSSPNNYGMTTDDSTVVRCGMNVTRLSSAADIDAGIGLEKVQMVELEEWLVSQGRPRSDVQMLRIDELAELGCCCFCSILYIANDSFLAAHPDKCQIHASREAGDRLVLSEPAKPTMSTLPSNPSWHSRQPKDFRPIFAYFQSRPEERSS